MRIVMRSDCDQPLALIYRNMELAEEILATKNRYADLAEARPQLNLPPSDPCSDRLRGEPVEGGPVARIHRNLFAIPFVETQRHRPFERKDREARSAVGKHFHRHHTSRCKLKARFDYGQ